MNSIIFTQVNMQQRLSNFFTIKKSQETIFNPFAQEIIQPPTPKPPVNIVNILDSPVQTTETCVFVPEKEQPKLFPQQDEPVEMIQPVTKDGKRLLYKYPKLPKVGPKGCYQLLVGESDLSETAWLIQFDGAANPNPGPASSGAVLWSPKDLDGKRTPIFESGKYLGKATNNIAEVQGLLLGLQIAAMRGARELLIEGDSELIIFQQTGRYRVSDKNLKVWWANIQAAMMDETSFDWIAIRQVPRELNERADSITKEVLSKKQSFQRA
jgi:ribonuclease HI